MRGGRLKVVGSRPQRVRRHRPQMGGAAIRALSQSQGLPVYIVDSTSGSKAPGQGGLAPTAGAVQHRRVLGDLQQRVQLQRGHRQRRQPGFERHARRRQRGRHLRRRRPLHHPRRGHRPHREQPRGRAAGRCSSSATTAPGRWPSRAPRCGPTPATGSRPTAIPASSSSAATCPPKAPRSSSHPSSQDLGAAAAGGGARCGGSSRRRR